MLTAMLDKSNPISNPRQLSEKNQKLFRSFLQGFLITFTLFFGLSVVRQHLISGSQFVHDGLSETLLLFCILLNAEMLLAILLIRHLGNLFGLKADQLFISICLPINTFLVLNQNILQQFQTTPLHLTNLFLPEPDPNSQKDLTTFFAFSFLILLPWNIKTLFETPKQFNSVQSPVQVKKKPTVSGIDEETRRQKKKSQISREESRISSQHPQKQSHHSLSESNVIAQNFSQLSIN